MIDTIEWDALYGNGDGGSYTASNQQLITDGLISNVDVERPAGGSLVSLAQSNVDLTFAVEMVGASLNSSTGNLLVVFGGSSVTDPDFTITENGSTILTGDFLSNFYFGGTLGSGNALIATGNITVTGGDNLLVAALGGTGAIVELPRLELTTSVFNFMPSLGNLLGDGIPGNEDFNVAFSGTLRPLNPSPFVPEPGTMALLGMGLLGLLAVGRRRSR